MTRTLTETEPEESDEIAVIRAAVVRTFEIRLKRRKHLRVGAAAVSLIVVGGAITAGAVAVAQASKAVTANSVACYETASLSSRRADFAQATDAYDIKTGKRVLEPAPDLLALCQLAWRSGELGNVTPVKDPNKGTYPVPRLTLCKGLNGVAAGFPNRDGRISARQLCDQVGLTTWPGQ